GQAPRRATSFMKAAIFDGWRKAHPDWPFVEKAEARTGADMIRVPLVEVAGQKVGPVWFTRRPDKAFDEFMSPTTDAPVVGARGWSEHSVGAVSAISRSRSTTRDGSRSSSADQPKIIERTIAPVPISTADMVSATTPAAPGSGPSSSARAVPMA